MNSSLRQLALRELHAVFTSRLSRTALVLATVAMTVSGPFGTFERYGLGVRLIYWAAMVLGCYLTGTAVGNVLLAVLQPIIGQRWPRVIVAGLLTGVPVTAVVAIINAIADQSFSLRGLLPIWINATLVTLVVFTGLVLLGGQLRAMRGAAEKGATPAEPPTLAPAAVPKADAPPPILARVPLPQRGRLLALLVEDHYVDIVTDKGKALVLLRLADAMRETAPVAGLQIHRSHWVARDAVVKTHRADGKLTLELSNGLRLPVSRGYLPAVRAAGFMTT